jgi:hypothetical protein
LLPRRLLGRLLGTLLAVLLRGVRALLPLVLARLTRGSRNLPRLPPLILLKLLLLESREGLPTALFSAAAAAAAARLQATRVGLPLAEPSESVVKGLLIGWL